MTLIPVFKIGVFNAWILGVWFLIPPLLLRILSKRAARRLAHPVYPRAGKAISVIVRVIMVATAAYSIFLPLKLGTAWFYVGVPIAALGILLSLWGGASTIAIPPEEPFTKGPYRFSRHPLYVAHSLIFIGIGVACASWVVLLAGVVFIVLQATFVGPEERFCLERYEDAYREYMRRTPRWIGIPKLRKGG